VVDALDFDHVRKPPQTVQSVQTLELASSSFFRFFGTFDVGKINLLLQAFELVAVRTQQVFVIFNPVV
jgi:hypothetical protein